MFPADSNEPQLVAWSRNPKVRRTLTLSILWLGVAICLIAFHAVLLPFALAVLLAFVIEPLVSVLVNLRLGRWRIPRLFAVLTLYTLMFALLYFVGGWSGRQLAAELSRLGGVKSGLLTQIQIAHASLLDSLALFAEQHGLPIDRDRIELFVDENIGAAIRELYINTDDMFTVGRDVVAKIFRIVFGSFLILMLTAFLSIDSVRIERFFRSMVPPEYQGAYDRIVAGASVGLAGVVRGQLVICLTNGVLTFIGLWILEVKLPVLLACTATVFSLVPIFGSILSTVPIVAMALLDDWKKAMFALLWIIGIHLLEANLLNPKIMGDAAKIHPVLVVFALLVGEHTAGLTGALFAVPIASVLLTIFGFLHQRALDVPLTQDLPKIS